MVPTLSKLRRTNTALNCAAIVSVSSGIPYHFAGFEAVFEVLKIRAPLSSSSGLSVLGEDSEKKSYHNERAYHIRLWDMFITNTTVVAWCSTYRADAE